MINKRKNIKALERNSLIFKDIMRSYCTKELILPDKAKQDFVQKIKNILSSLQILMLCKPV
ncbi:MAG: hypothetical protein H6Q12_743 [Bacteroidetes bacterium]|nr:hypothetical protein [Bacteroidota bacterium]